MVETGSAEVPQEGAAKTDLAELGEKRDADIPAAIDSKAAIASGFAMPETKAASEFEVATRVIGPADATAILLLVDGDASDCVVGTDAKDTSSRELLEAMPGESIEWL